MLITMAIDLDGPQQDLMCKHLGISAEELDDILVVTAFTQWISDGMSNVKGGHIWTTHQIEGLILSAVRNGLISGGIRLRGLTDKELGEIMPGVKKETLRWVRYNMTKRGVLKQGGTRTSGKFWIEREIDHNAIAKRIEKVTNKTCSDKV